MGLHIFFKKGHEKHVDSLLDAFVKKFHFEIDGEALRVSNHLGYLRKNEGSDAKIYGNIELDLFEDKVGVVTSFFDLVKCGIVSKEALDLLFMEYREHLLRAYIDIDGEGSPLDILYEYSFDGRKMIHNLIKALEFLAEKDDSLADLYDKVKEMERNTLSSKLWEHETVRSRIFQLASKSGVIAQEGSIKIYAEEKERLEAYYKSMIHEILEPLFKESFEDKLKRAFG